MSGDVYRIDVGFPDGEYLLIENHQNLLIWQIDDNMFTDWQSAPGWPLQGGWPGNGNHYQVALLSPDKRYDTERGANYGDDGDCWTKGNTLGPGPARETVDPNQVSMYPNTDSYRGGVIKNTGIRIFDISEVGEVMSFRVAIPGCPLHRRRFRKINQPKWER
jgi:hypothetical protein